MAPKASLKVNGSIEGTFQSSKTITIRDQTTKQDKEVMCYSFCDETGEPFVLLGTYQLDLAFEGVFDGEGGEEKCQGLHMIITRGDDTKLSRGRTMGNYEITVSEAD